MDSVYLTVSPASNSLGLAYYNSSLGVIYVAQTSVLSPDFTFLEPVLHELSPEVVLCPKSAPDSLKRVLGGCNVQYCAKSEFSYDKCKEMVLSLYNGKAFYAKSKFDLSAVSLVGAVGALLSYLMRSPELLDEVAIHDIQTVQLAGVMVDLATLRALHVFVEEMHPSKIKGAGRSKEGFSVFGLIDHTVTSHGRRLLRQWLLRPLADLAAIQTRLEAVEFLASQPPLAGYLSRQLQGSADLERTVGRFVAFRESSSDWSGLTSTLCKFVTLQQALKNHAARLPPALAPILSVPDLTDFLGMLNTVLDTATGLHIASGVSEELEYWRKTFDDLQSFLVELSQEELRDLSRAGVACSQVRVIHIAKYGFLMEVHHINPEVSSEDLRRFQHLQYELMFQTEATGFFRSPRTKELDAHFGDVNSKIVDAEAAILRQVEEHVISQGAVLCQVSRVTAELDALISLAAAAVELGLSRPNLVSQPGISIVNGRHLLVERVVDNYIPNDCLLEGAHKLALITGPNCSGKSVYLKTVGVIVFLSHIGSFVPAESAEIGIVDGIFVRLTNPQYPGTSSFELELQQLSRCLAASSERSLILLDEFGKTTASEDCVALLVALIRHLDRASAPLTMITTHYTELVTLDLVKESAVVRFYAMEMAPVDEPVFLYKLIRGVARHSLAFSCAKLAGLPTDFLERARLVRSCMREGREVEPLGQSSYLSRAKEALRLLRNYDPETDDLDAFLEAVRLSVKS